MIKVEVFMTIWVLHQQGSSVREIARRLSVSRNTVRRYRRCGDEMPRYARQSCRPSKLDSVRAYLERRIDRALPRRLPATVLFRGARALGYTSGERSGPGELTGIVAPAVRGRGRRATVAAHRTVGAARRVARHHAAVVLRASAHHSVCVRRSSDAKLRHVVRCCALPATVTKAPAHQFARS